MKSSQEANHLPGHFDDIMKLVESEHVDLKSELVKGEILKGKVQGMTVQMDELNTSITSEVSSVIFCHLLHLTPEIKSTEIYGNT